jgi:hypothetical protein
VRDTAWLFTGLSLVLVYGLSAATKHMMFGYRLLLPYLPAMFVAVLLLRRGPGREPTDASSALEGRSFAACISAMALQGFVMAYVYGTGVNPSFVGEFTHFSAERMQRYSNEIWEPFADDVRRHWSRHPEAGTRAPRLYTWEAGQMPYRMRELHVYDNGLISWRHACEFSSMASADYVLIWPSNPQPPGRMERVTTRNAPSPRGPGQGGAGAFVLYFNRSPQRHRLGPAVNDPCTERPRIREAPRRR